ncbi:uncharacterized protein METZ01_LOCUS236295, partial [marine metagenome]
MIGMHATATVFESLASISRNMKLDSKHIHAFVIA